MAKFNKNVPYYLLIHTNSYTGNFERELVAYSIGKLDELQEEGMHAREYTKAFWNKVISPSINSYEEYIQRKKENSEFMDIIKKAEALLGQRTDEETEEDVTELYDSYLCETYQSVDDWEQDTFYNIDSFYKNEKYNCDTILIQFNKPLSEYLENIVIERIKEFFDAQAYNIINDYIWLSHYGEIRTKKDVYKLLDLELVDSNGNLIKKYV